jgi:hypothetical protein
MMLYLYGIVLAAPAIGIYLGLTALGVADAAAALIAWAWVPVGFFGILLWRRRKRRLLEHLVDTHGLEPSDARLSFVMPSNPWRIHLWNAHRSFHQREDAASASPGL